MRERQTIESEIQTSARYDVLFLLSGVFGLYFLILSVDGITFKKLPVLLIMLLSAGLFGFLEEHLKRMQILFFFSMTAVASAFVSLSSPLLRAQMNLVLFSMFVGTPEDETDISLAAAFLMFVMILLFFLMESVLKTHWLLYFVTTWLLLINPMIGVDAGVPSMVLLAIFQVSFWAMHGMSGRRFRKEERALERRRRRILQSGERLPQVCLLQKWMKTDEPYRGKVTFRAGLSASALLLLVLPLSALLSLTFTEPFYRFSTFEEKTFHLFLSQIGLGAGAISGRINRGNVYPVGFRELYISTDAPPEEVLYLKGFVGGDYENGSWAENTDLYYVASLRSFLSEISLSGTDASHVLDALLYDAEEEYPDLDREPCELTIEVLHENGPFLPYISKTILKEEEDRLYTVSCYSPQAQSIDIRETKVRDFFSHYEELALGQYTALPEGSLSKIRSLVSESGLDRPDFESALRYVYSVLEENTSYSMTPGIAPLSEDPIEHFLFESHEGYCQHYASAAVMLFRLLGIPARYAAGFAVTGADFEETEDGTFRAVVTDYNAHAWAEVYLPESGWTPVEVTPSGKSLEDAYPAFDLSFLAGLGGDFSWSLPTTARRTEDFQEAALFSLPKSGGPLIFLALSGAIALLLIIWHLNFSPELARGDIRILYRRMVRHLDRQGLLMGMDGLEEDFAEKIAASPLKEAGLSREAAEAAVSAVGKALFAKDPALADQEREDFRAVYRICMRYRKQK